MSAKSVILNVIRHSEQSEESHDTLSNLKRRKTM
jgi:hypothetical protein